ncbi:hypothetical protein JCM4814A_49300 [Streptomyces phaeofaciens JCM 4814]|uniref:Novel STAND NTPase 1 domain-containing protein n=1 Tax=Streptomyces phaeofaciens TaxID=68254 RepID=A0A918H3K0_9ACTN|nr:trypsin-like peptidase domain-containing protein [Streptomyces phaeofaciens]GGT32550.1 hypothetical protein GCM10010226_05960 [Streptomyces phaeofaciens]
MSDIRSSIVRVWDANGRVVGAGFLVGARHVITCEHVALRAATGRAGGPPRPGSGPSARPAPASAAPASAAPAPADPSPTEPVATGPVATGPVPADPIRTDPVPTAPVQIDFPFLDVPGPPLRARLRRLGSARLRGLDVMGLVLEEDPPAGAVPARLSMAESPWGRRFRTAGFPTGRDHGEYATGRVRDLVDGDWLQIEAEHRTGARVRQGYSGSPLWNDDLGAATGMVVAADREDRDRIAYAIPAALLVEAWSEVLQARSVPPCPYRGLSAFDEGSAAHFHGREDIVHRLVRRAEEFPVTALVSPSGTGKSSVLAAGVLPAVRANGSWLPLRMRPGRDPIASLSFAVANAMEAHPDAARWTKTPSEVVAALREQSFADLAHQLLQQSGRRRLLLVVDQFEELLTLCRDAAVRDGFIEIVAEAARRGGGAHRPVTVLLALRADREQEAVGRSKALGLLLGSNAVRLDPLNDEALRQALERPAAAHAVAFEPGLVDRILTDLRGRGGALPLLEFLLLLLWEQQEDRTLTWSAYHRLGGVGGALTRYADTMYDHLTGQEARSARRVLLQLVGLAEGSADTRRPLLEREVRPGDWALVQRLADERLLCLDRNEKGEEVAELVHESLAWNWDRLHLWITDADRRLKESDRRADRIGRRFSIGAGAANLLPPPMDAIMVGATFARMGQQMAKAYDVEISWQVLRTAGIAMAEGIAAVAGAMWGGTALLKAVPTMSVWVALLIQPPLVAAIAYSVATTWKYYFHVVCAGGRGPDNAELREFVTIALRGRLHQARTKSPSSTAKWRSAPGPARTPRPDESPRPEDPET